MKNFILSLFFILLISPSSAYAQEQIRCESNGNRYQICRTRIDQSSNVRIIKTHSKARCRRGSSWGVDRSGIWVDKGCRADFLIVRNNRSDSYNSGYYNGDRGNNSYRRRNSRRDRFRDDYRDDYRGSNTGNYDSRERDSYYNERRKLEDERRAFEAEKREYERRGRGRGEGRVYGNCPKGSRIGRCTSEQRARGCKDWKTSDLTPCKSGG